MSETVPQIVVLVRDLMFSGRISAEARAAGVPVQMLRDPAKLPESAEPSAHLLIVDLNLDGAIAAAATWRQTPGRRAVGFVSHVDSATIDAARKGAIDQVLARSAFVTMLPDMLKRAGDG